MHEEEILNEGLALALEFGSDWLQPIQARLLSKFPELKIQDVNRYDKICKIIMKKGNEYIYKKLGDAASQRKTIKREDLADDLQSFLERDYPWINSENMKRILSQGYYYAWKDGLDMSLSN